MLGKGSMEGYVYLCRAENDDRNMIALVTMFKNQAASSRSAVDMCVSQTNDISRLSIT